MTDPKYQALGFTGTLAHLRTITPRLRFELHAQPNSSWLQIRVEVGRGTYIATREFKSPIADSAIVSALADMHKEVCGDITRDAQQRINRKRDDIYTLSKECKDLEERKHKFQQYARRDNEE